MNVSENLLVAQSVAKMLLEIKAVRLNPEKPFQWASGWNSPIYCDNRHTLSFPKVRTAIRQALAEMITEKFPRVEVIAGVATAGIPQGVLVADALGLPFVYVRPEPKKHGMGNQIEGRLEEGKQIVILEDLISTGGSSLKVVDVLRESGAEVLGMAAIFTYGFEVAANNFAQKNVKLQTLSNYSILLDEAVKLGYVSENHLQTLAEWRENPEAWGK